MHTTRVRVSQVQAAAAAACTDLYEHGVGWTMRASGNFRRKLASAPAPAVRRDRTRVVDDMLSTRKLADRVRPEFIKQINALILMFSGRQVVTFTVTPTG